MRKSSVALCVITAMMTMTGSPIFADVIKTAPGISDMSVDVTDTHGRVSVSINDESKLSDDVTLVVTTEDNISNKINATDIKIYEIGNSQESDLTAELDIGINEIFKYYLMNPFFGTLKNYAPTAPGDFACTPKKNALRMSWSKAEDDYNKIQGYKLKVNGEEVTTLSPTITQYDIVGLQANEVYNFEISAIDDAGLESVSAQKEKAFPVPGDAKSWTFDIAGDKQTADGLTYTDENVKLNLKSSACKIVEVSGEEVIEISRGDAEQALAIIFGSDVEACDKVSVSFDYFGSKAWQTPKYIVGGVETQFQIKQDWSAVSFSTNTVNDLADYGYSGKNGVIINYSGSGDEKLWIKNLKVSTTDYMYSEVDADSSGYSYNEGIVPLGNPLNEMHGNAIAGTVIKSSTSDWANATGYAYRNVDGVDAFYFTQLYDTAAGKALWVDKSFMGFDIVSDNKYDGGAWVNVEYYDGTVEDFATMTFNILANESKYNSMKVLATVEMTGDNTWKNICVQLPNGASYFNKGVASDDLDTADIAFSLVNVNDGYNKNGILIKSISVMDNAFYEKYYK